MPDFGPSPNGGPFGQRISPRNTMPKLTPQTNKILWVSAACAALAGLGTEAHAALASASDSHVTFEGKGPAGFKVTGSTTDLSVAEADGNVVITVPLANLNTGIDLRDHHMKEKYLEVPKYPSAVLTIARSALRVPAGGERVEADAPGTLTLHGQTHPVSVHYDAKQEGPAYLAHGRFHINMNDYGVNVPSYLGVTVKPDIDVSASLHVAGN
jgi:polyisoprenoid-binding protein YceI